MACDPFRDQVARHAHGAPLDERAAAHLAVCSRCQALCDVERRVVNMIGATLDEIASVRPGADFVARARARAEAAPPRTSILEWLVPVLSVSAVAVIVFAVVGWVPGDAPAGERSVAPSARTPAIVVPSPVGHEEAASDHSPTAAVPARVVRERLRVHSLGGAPPPRAPLSERSDLAFSGESSQVLVPAHEREAVGRLFASLRQGRPEVVSMLMRLQTTETQSADPAGVTVVPIRIEPVIVPTLPTTAVLEK